MVTVTQPLPSFFFFLNLLLCLYDLAVVLMLSSLWHGKYPVPFVSLTNKTRSLLRLLLPDYQRPQSRLKKGFQGRLPNQTVCFLRALVELRFIMKEVDGGKFPCFFPNKSYLTQENSHSCICGIFMSVFLTETDFKNRRKWWWLNSMPSF